MRRYNPTEIEKKWQDKWEADGTYRVDLHDHSKPKYYGFSMLPGITGAGIHIGHGRTFQFSDIKVRAKRQQGFNAYHPIGWDSFGLPVENYAIKVGKKPRQAHDEAKENFISQLKRLGYSYDWSKEISTADPEYYKWTQWIFNQLFENDLAYQKEQPQWWCETDQTVLANEQVEGGKCWRCGNQVTKKNLKQWFFRITAYADEILEATDSLNWTEMVKTMQKNWIGRSEGAEVEFSIAPKSKIDNPESSITVFTTRPDTLFGATFLVLAPEHELVPSLTTTEQKAAVEAYAKQAESKSEVERMDTDREKTGVFTGSYAINPVNDEEIPIWVADYVLWGYGTGAIMAVPAHDERDNAFAKKFDLPIRQVIAEEFNERLDGGDRVTGANVIGYDPETNRFMGMCNMVVDAPWLVSGGREGEEDYAVTARRELAEEAGYHDVQELIPLGGFFYTYYFNPTKQTMRKGTGKNYLAIISEKEAVQPANEAHEKYDVVWWTEQELLAISDGWGEGFMHWKAAVKDAVAAARAYKNNQQLEPDVFTGDGVLVNSGAYDDIPSAEARELIVQHLERKSQGELKTNYKIRDWLISRQRYWGAPIPIVHCTKDGAVAVPDDQLPVLLPDLDDFKPHDGKPSALATATDWVNTTCPRCGGPAQRETDTMDGYACSSWYFLRYFDPFNDKQAWDPKQADYWYPVDYYNGADHAVAHLLYSRFWARFFFKQGLLPDPEPFKRMMYNAYIMAPDGQKMSKSKGNVIDPMEIMDSGYGADALRLYEMFIAPYDLDAPWDTRGVPGTYRFLNRVWNLVQEYIEAPAGGAGDNDQEVLKIAHLTIKKVTGDIEDEKFNTAVSAMMEAVNNLYKLKEAVPISKNEAWQFVVESLLQMLAPFAPHICEELWHELGHNDTIHVDHWPEWDEDKLVSDTVKIVVQVNGKLRANIEIPTDVSREDLEVAALANERVKEYVGDKKPTRVVVVPGRLVNIVV